MRELISKLVIARPPKSVGVQSKAFGIKRARFTRPFNIIAAESESGRSWRNLFSLHNAARHDNGFNVYSRIKAATRLVY